MLFVLSTESSKNINCINVLLMESLRIVNSHLKVFRLINVEFGRYKFVIQSFSFLSTESSFKNHISSLKFEIKNYC